MIPISYFISYCHTFGITACLPFLLSYSILLYEFIFRRNITYIFIQPDDFRAQWMALKLVSRDRVAVEVATAAANVLLEARDILSDAEVEITFRYKHLVRFPYDYFDHLMV